MKRRRAGLRWALVIFATIVALSLSYGLALWGEPSSAWLWGLPS